MASYYYNYDFVSCEPLLARVKEELKSYFATGMIDDLLFPLYVEDCLKRLGKGMYEIAETVLIIDDFSCPLPPDFDSVREAWVCTRTQGQYFKLPGNYYKQVTTRISDDHLDQPIHCDPQCDPCTRTVELHFKVSTEVLVNSFQTSYLLKPGNIHARRSCGTDCPNLTLQSTSDDTFDIRNNQFQTTFREGEIYLTYYSKGDQEGFPLIPDNLRIQEYIEAYIKYKMFESLWNTVTDETFNQIDRKFQVYKQEMKEKWVIADTESRKKTLYERIQGINRVEGRLNRYNIR